MLHVFRIKGPRRNCLRCGNTMTAMMIYDGKRVAAGGARLQWHVIPIADIDLIARNTGRKSGRVFTFHHHRPEVIAALDELRVCQHRHLTFNLR